RLRQPRRRRSPHHHRARADPDSGRGRGHGGHRRHLPHQRLRVGDGSSRIEEDSRPRMAVQEQVHEPQEHRVAHLYHAQNPEEGLGPGGDDTMRALKRNTLLASVLALAALAIVIACNSNGDNPNHSDTIIQVLSVTPVSSDPTNTAVSDSATIMLKAIPRNPTATTFFNDVTF